MKEHATRSSLAGEYDVVVVGAGFAGLYLLIKLREIGVSARAFEAGGGIGGTWYWNRYPGARCDVESMQYSYSFSEDLQQEWEWPERYSAQPDILRYANHVADHFDLRPMIQLDTRVQRAEFDDSIGRWRLCTSHGDEVSAQFCVMATGCLSSAQTPNFPGLDDFKGSTYHTGQWPHEKVNFTGKRVGLIGTGSSAIQSIPVIAEEAAHLTVFQRTPNYSIPTRNAPMTPEYEASWKKDYSSLREAARQMPTGVWIERNPRSALEVGETERREIYAERWKVGGTGFMGSFKDLVTSQEANDTASEFVRGKIREIVKDPQVAELLAPKDYPIGTKRICVDSHYFETFNRDDVTLVDVRSSSIERITQRGLVTGGTEYEFDCLVFATGFDAMTGTLNAIDIRGRNGDLLRDKWKAGPRTYLGVMVAGFPNLYMVTGPGSPSVLSNMMVSIEQHVNWIVDALSYLSEHQLSVMEANADAEDEWVEHVNEVAYKTLYPKAASWYMGANVPGKPRLFMPYIGGVPQYASQCAAIASGGYEGFELRAAALAESG